MQMQKNISKSRRFNWRVMHTHTWPFEADERALPCASTMVVSGSSGSGPVGLVFTSLAREEV